MGILMISSHLHSGVGGQAVPSSSSLPVHRSC